MAYEKRNGEFTLFANDYKKSDKHPDMKGHGLGLNGEELDIALWKRTSQNGKEYFSIRIEPARAQQQTAPAAYARPQDVPDKAAAARIASAKAALEQSLDPQEEDLPF